MYRLTSKRIPRSGDVTDPQPVSDDDYLRFFQGLGNAIIGSAIAWIVIYLIYKAFT